MLLAPLFDMLSARQPSSRLRTPMPEFNPYSPPTTDVAIPRRGMPPPRNVSHAVRQGAWIGIKWTTYVTALLLLFELLASLGPQATTREFETSRAATSRSFAPLKLLGEYVTSCLGGALIGGAVFPAVYYAKLRRLSSQFRVSRATPEIEGEPPSVSPTDRGIADAAQS